MKSIIFKYNLTQKRWEDMRGYQEMLNEIFPNPIDSTAKNRLYLCEKLLHNDAVKDKNFLYSLSKQSIENYLKEVGE